MMKEETVLAIMLCAILLGWCATAIMTAVLLSEIIRW